MANFRTLPAFQKLRFLRGFSVLAVFLAMVFGFGPRSVQPFAPREIGASNPPYVDNETVTNISPPTATVSWTTSINDCGDVNYGLTSGALDQRVNDPGPCEAGTHSVTLTGLQADKTYYYEVVMPNPFGFGGPIGGGERSFSTGTLSVTNVQVVSITSTSATVTWETNVNADATVNYGLGTTYGLVATSGAAASTSHSVPLSGLSASTTYHYQVVSMAGGQTAQSAGDRTFTTSSGGGTGGGPTIVFGPRYDATSVRADVTFKTDVPTVALIEYDTTPETTPDPASPTYAQACDPSSPCPPAAPGASDFTEDHTVRLFGLAEPSKNYQFRITVTEQAPLGGLGSSFVGNYTLTTSGGTADHVFSTGTCTDSDNTPIGQCTRDGRYCRPGGGEPVFDCVTDAACRAACSTGSTCQPNGDCLGDPTLTGLPTECNPQFCYQKCNAASDPAKIGQACTADSDCSSATYPGGSCDTGAFDDPAVPGCFSSWPSCDANIILKVRPDRVCGKWLTCQTSLPVTDASGKTENQCFDLTACDSLSSGGQCNNFLEGRQCSNDPLRFCTRDQDCIAPGTCRSPDDPPLSLTFKTPADVGQIKNLSGYAYAGLDWNKQPDNPHVEGYYPLTLAKQVGQRVTILNGNFEDFEFKSGNPRLSWWNSQIIRYWTADGATSAVAAGDEGSFNTENHFMKITPTKDNHDLDIDFTGAISTSDLGLRTQANQQYIVSIRMKTSTPPDEHPVQISFADNDGKDKQILDDGDGDNLVKITGSWRTYRLGPVKGIGGVTKIRLLTTVEADPPIDFYVDDLAITPVLQLNDVTQIPESCRLYPRDNSPACEYTDENSLNYNGLRGFCLERDPLNTAVCLNWWPIDIVAGDNIFGQEADVGYRDRQPLFACAEAEGSSSLLKHEQLMSTNYTFTYACSEGFCGGMNCQNVRGVCGAGDDVFPQTYFEGAVDATDRQIHDYDIVAIHLKRIRAEGGMNVQENVYLDGKHTEGSNYMWEYSYSDADRNTATVGFKFNQQSHQLQFVYAYAKDGSNGSGGFAYEVYFFMRDKCTKVVEVAGASQVRAWADRTTSGSSYVLPDLNYRYVTDKAPFATAAPPAGAADNPGQWSSFLPVEGFNIDLAPAGQPRAGGAFASAGVFDNRICGGDSGTRVGLPCFTSADCNDGTLQGTCIGNGLCLKYDPNKPYFYDPTSSKLECSNNSNCPSSEECVGGAASGRGSQTIDNSVPVYDNNSLNTYTRFAQYHLMRLFTEAYSVWEWKTTTQKYERNNAATLWRPPTAVCKVCNAGSKKDLACTKDASCPGSTCVAAARHPAENADPAGDSTADYCAIPPRITNFGGENVPPAVSLGQGESFTLKFNTIVDREQVPIRRITVDWGDGSDPTEDDNLSLAPRDDPKKPFAYTHSYLCLEEDRHCEFYPRVQVEDNWGWCSDASQASGATPCNTNPNSSANPWAGGLGVLTIVIDR